MPHLIFHFRLFKSWVNRCPLGVIKLGLWILLSMFAPGVCVGSDGTDAGSNQTQMKVPYRSATNALGSWIWEEKTLDDQTCQLWNTFAIPKESKVTKARLVMTVDNAFTLYLDGRNLGRGAEWRELFIFDLTPLLTPGQHVLAVDCYNGSFFAGMLLGLQVDLADGQTI